MFLCGPNLLLSPITYYTYYCQLKFETVCCSRATIKATLPYVHYKSPPYVGSRSSDAGTAQYKQVITGQEALDSARNLLSLASTDAGISAALVLSSCAGGHPCLVAHWDRTLSMPRVVLYYSCYSLLFVLFSVIRELSGFIDSCYSLLFRTLFSVLPVL